MNNAEVTTLNEKPVSLLPELTGSNPYTNNDDKDTILNDQVNEIFNKNQLSYSLSIFESTEPEYLSKAYYYDEVEEKLKKVSGSGGKLFKGSYKKISVNSPEEFAGLLHKQTPKNAFAYGYCPRFTSATIVTKGHIEKHGEQEGEITRSRENFEYPSGAGIMVVDYDPPKDDKPALTHDELLKRLSEAVPELAKAPMVLAHSASSHIYRNSVLLKGAGGLRVYIFVANAPDIQRAGKALFNRLFLNGHGHIDVSRSGSFLQRTIIDDSVWQPERLDFVGGAKMMGDGLTQNRPAPEIINGNAEPFNLNLIKDLNESEKRKLAKLIKTHQQEKEPERQEKKRLWVENRILDIQSKPMPKEIASIGDKEERDKAFEKHLAEQKSKLMSAVEDRPGLYGDFILVVDKSKSEITVAQVVDDPNKWHGKYICDPLEPEYNNYKTCALILLKTGGKPIIKSYAHGGKTYDLFTQPYEIKYQGGDYPMLIKEAQDRLKKDAVVYQYGNNLCFVGNDGKINLVTNGWLRSRLEKLIAFKKYDKRTGDYHPADCPPELQTRIIENIGEWGLDELIGVTSGALFRSDGTLLNQQGYDPQTKLIYRGDDPNNDNIPLNPSREQLQNALTKLWEPFKSFPYAENISKGVQLAALFTQIQRRVLKTAPAFLYTAPEIGSGKSLNARTTCLISGSEPTPKTWDARPEDQNKKLLSVLIGNPESVFIDNVAGILKSDTLSAILTSDTYEDRLLGASKIATVSTRNLFVITGNNVTVGDDLRRRILLCRIDHRHPEPRTLKFHFRPDEMMKKNWREYRKAGLTLLAGFFAAGKPRMTEDSSGSYEDWDLLIRQSVLWIDSLQLTETRFADPLKSLEKLYEDSPENIQLERLMFCWFSKYGTSPVLVSELVSFVQSNADASEINETDKELISILTEIAEKKNSDKKSIDPVRLGQFLSKNTERVIGSKRFAKCSAKIHGAVPWRIEELY